MPLNIQPDQLSEISKELAKGNCVAIPTETVYGLAADATNGAAVARIFEMKKRPTFNPLIAHVSDLEMANKHATFDGLASMLVDAFWPGPLTLVLPLKATSDIDPLVTAGLETIALRCPREPARTIIEAYGKPLAAPSANQSGRVSLTTPGHVEDEYPDSDLMIVSGPPCHVGIESTILKVEHDEIIMLRPGAITSEMVASVTNIRPREPDNDSILAPGMMRSHYAPNAKLILDKQLIPEGANVLAFGYREKIYKPRRMFNLSSKASLQEAALNLYRGLKILDAIGSDVIYVQPIPMQGLGIAINDRLRRAAAPKDEDFGNE